MSKQGLEQAILKLLAGEDFSPGEPFAAAEVYALLSVEQHLPVDANEVYDALGDLAARGAGGLQRLPGDGLPRDRRYVLRGEQR